MADDREMTDDIPVAALTIAPTRVHDAELIEHDPETVLAEAVRAARTLKDVLEQKAKPIIMNGKQYLELEDWLTLGRFYGVTPKVEGEPEYVNIGGIVGFKSSAVAISVKDGRVLSRAVAFCLSDEEKWGARPKYEWHYVLRSGGTSKDDPGREEIIWEPKKSGEGNAPKKERVLVGEESVPLFQVASMSQTRAAAKVMRQVLSWVAVLAGYAPTPAEEMAGVEHDTDDTPPRPEPSAKPAPPPRAPGRSEVDRPGHSVQGLGEASDADAVLRLAVELEALTGKPREQHIEDASEFVGKDGKAHSFRDPRGKSVKWVGGTRRKLEAAVARTGALEAGSDDEPPF